MLEGRALGFVAKYRNVFVISPADLVTGGPESLHQLAHAIRQQGGNAFISYYPRGCGAGTPEAYRGYDLAVADPVDEPGNLVVIPESAAGIVWEFKRASTAIWWLSVDNFYGPRPESDTEYRRLVEMHAARSACAELTGRPTWDEIRKIRNFAQSAYAASFLAQRNIASVMLETPPHSDFLAAPLVGERQDRIAFNPKKGAAVVERLSRRFPEFGWLPLTGLTRSGMRDALATAKLYVDFGFHPGRERMPREAALCGACVVTGKRGSARFPADIPIPGRYRLDEQGVWFERLFAWTARSILRNHAWHAQRFEPYRRFVAALSERFPRQVAAAFFDEAQTPT